MTGAALLDVNVLVALFNPVHVHHEIAHDWFADHRESGTGWATCPLTENGFLRVLGNPARTGEFVPLPRLVEHLRRWCANDDHQFWPDVLSLRDARLFNVSRLRGHKQIADIYLLGLAVKRGGCLVTFDRKISLGAVKAARPDSLTVLTSSA